MERYPVDLTHYSMMAGKIGRLQTLSCIPTVAGDSIEIGLEGQFRLSALRRQLVVDSKVDLFAFHVKHRHVYGEDVWNEFILEGINETQTLPGVAVGNVCGYLGLEIDNGDTLAKWVTAGYNRIWNRYARAPTDDAGIKADTDITVGTSDEAFYGYNCGFLPTGWSTGIYGTGVADADREVTVSGGVYDIVDLDRVKAQYRTEARREFFGARYPDIMEATFGSKVPAEAEQTEKPELLAHESFWLSGYDVDGTDDATLGEYSGKGVGYGKLYMPPKYFSEHGALWIMALVRFPPIHQFERPWLHLQPNPTYKELSGDPDLWRNEPPRQYTQDEFFRSSGTGASLGVMPYGLHYRYHPSNVHRRFINFQGFSFLSKTINSEDDAHYHQDAEYDGVFIAANGLGHWQSQANIYVKAKRVIPPAVTSVFAGG